MLLYIGGGGGGGGGSSSSSSSSSRSSSSSSSSSSSGGVKYNYILRLYNLVLMPILKYDEKHETVKCIQYININFRYLNVNQKI